MQSRQAKVTVPASLGRRGVFLLFLAQLDLIYAFSLYRPTPASRLSPTSLFLIEVAPLWAWGTLWAVVGLLALIFAFRVHDGIGYGACIFIKLLWGMLFLLGWVIGEVERGYLSAAIWLTFAGVLSVIATWPDESR